MKFFKWSCAEDSATVVPVNGKQWSDLNPINLNVDGLAAIEMQIAKDSGRSGKILDLLTTGLPTPKIISNAAVKELSDFLGRAGTVIECSIRDLPSQYSYFVPTRYLRMLSELKSDIRRSAFVTHVRTAVLDCSAWDGSDIFGLAGFPMAGVYVSQPFVERVLRSSLSGFDFQFVECA